MQAHPLFPDDDKACPDCKGSGIERVKRDQTIIASTCYRCAGTGRSGIVRVTK